MTFKALLATRPEKEISVNLVELDDDDLMPGDVTIDVEYSTVNYKDALALSGKAGVIQKFPLIPGIDLAGTVRHSSNPGFAAGDRVLVNGWGLSQTHHGGYAQRARVGGEWLVKVPQQFSTCDAMAIGTAGYTAMLSVMALEHGGIDPSRGDILVTGANGGGDRLPSRSCRGLATASLHRLAAWKKLTTCKLWGRPRSLIAALCPNRVHRLRANAGPGQWIRWEATRWPM